MKAFLIGLTLAVLFDAAAFRGNYREAIAEASVHFAHWLVNEDWQLTHN